MNLKVRQQSQKTMRLNEHEKYTHYGQVLQDMVRELGIFVVPTLSGGKHLYGQVHMDPMGISNPLSITKMDPFNPDLMLAAQVFYNKQITFFPTRLIWMADYVKDATKTLFRLNHKDANPATHYRRHPLQPEIIGGVRIRSG